jgi:hypothetical protein
MPFHRQSSLKTIILVFRLLFGLKTGFATTGSLKNRDWQRFLFPGCLPQGA